MRRGTGEPIELPEVLGTGGTWHDGGTRIDWTFQLGDGWDSERITNVFLVPFVGTQVVVLRLPWGHSPVGGATEPGEHWCVTATRELVEEAGARLRQDSGGPLLHPFGILRCHSHAPEPYRAHQPHPVHLRV